jgi:hypothetical protein
MKLALPQLETGLRLLDSLCDDAQHPDRRGQPVVGGPTVAKAATNVEIAIAELQEALTLVNTD